TVAVPPVEYSAGALGLALLRQAGRQPRLDDRLVVCRTQLHKSVAVDGEVEHAVTAGAAELGPGPGLLPHAAGMLSGRARKQDHRLTHLFAPSLTPVPSHPGDSV